MPRLEASTRAHARDLVESMRSFDPDRPRALSWVTQELPRFMRCEKALVGTFRQRGDRIAVASFDGVGLREASGRTFDDWLESQPPVGWTAFNPVRPEPPQRNRIWDYAQLERHLGGSRVTYPMYQLYGRLGIARDEQIRVLVCDRASLLAYVGVYQPDGFTSHQKAALNAIVPALQQRLTLERLIAHSERWAAALKVALEAIACPAFVASAQGTIHELNTSARELLDRAGTDVRRALVDAIARRPGSYAFDLTPLRMTASPPCYLAVVRDGWAEARHAICAAAASTRWGLTQRRRQVLEFVVRGMSNATIAAELGVSERAVEAHVSHIFDRAGVENRAALVAAVMRTVA